MSWPCWLAIGAAAFALGTVVDERIGAAFDHVVTLAIAVPILVVVSTWDALQAAILLVAVWRST